MATSVQKCVICKSSEVNDLDLGEMKTKDGCNIHLFCALLSKHSVQNGTDSQGIDGFLPTDIQNLAKLHTKTKCCYCRERSATVFCKIQNCSRRFHVKCAVENKCLLQFEGEFHSYCHQHVDIKEKNEIHADWWSCQICKDRMGPYDPITSIPSCCNQGFFHRSCAQKHAKAAGYLTKCPCCGCEDDVDGNNYRQLLALRGIFCPDKDADWELTQGAYRSLLFVYKNCDAKNCLCPNGRKHGETNGSWRLIKCNYCGESGIHVGCRSNNTDKNFMCEDCSSKSIPLVTVYTQSLRNHAESTHGSSIDVVDDDDENASNDESNGREEDILKLVRSAKLFFRPSTLVMANQNCDVDPLCDDERAKMRKARLDMFFEKSDFNVKPPALPWLI